MVFLRLTVKVLPRERLFEGSQSSKLTPTTTGEHENNGVVAGGASSDKPTTFLVPVDNPEEVTLGGLAGLIQDMWKRLRPNFGQVFSILLLSDTNLTPFFVLQKASGD